MGQKVDRHRAGGRGSRAGALCIPGPGALDSNTRFSVAVALWFCGKQPGACAPALRCLQRICSQHPWMDPGGEMGYREDGQSSAVAFLLRVVLHADL